MNGAITLISTINLCFKDTSICNADVGVGGGGHMGRGGCMPDPPMGHGEAGLGGGGAQGHRLKGEGGVAGPLSDVCQLTSGCRNK